ncbi:dual specificity protein phosphatase 12 [Ornithorhynchus anatinus]|uniref:Dual specificity protein phosphatase 12 n=1 Tax=Ornithorhynchus anatinus TaxID=9258 RepID=A0A6I8PSP5_ORNAN|nr:dual specificity protein phosphatase 12 [Ornithorhynchus anatinus]
MLCGAVELLPGLLLGGAAAARAARAARAGAGVTVTALLTVQEEEEEAAEQEAEEGGLQTLVVPVRDEPRQDLLGSLDRCAAFIGRVRRGGGAVLVHCHAGVSRSVAVVTAFLMKTQQLSFEEAYARVRALRPQAKMNEGFEEQLKLYEAMGCQVDASNPSYKQYRLQKVTEKYPELRNLPREVFAADPDAESPGLREETLYRCRKCRRALFRSSSVLGHPGGSGPAAFAHKRKTPVYPPAAAGPASCTSHFVEPVQWMEAALLGVMEGQLLCPKCGAKLGSFSWCGERCSCGSWVTPAFQVHKNRVDEARALPARVPPAGRPGACPP